MRTTPVFLVTAMPHAREISIHMLTTDTLKHHHNTEHQIPLGLRLRIRRDGAHGVDNLRIMGSKGESVIRKNNFLLYFGLG